MLELLIEHSLLLPNQKDTIQLFFRKDGIHPLYPRMIMLVVRLSGLDSKVLDYQKTLKVSFCVHEKKQPEQAISQYYESGKDSGKIIPIIQLYIVS